MTTATDKKVDIACDHCNRAMQVKPTAKGSPRLPRGWKRHDNVWCDKCWKNNWKLRAIAIPIAGPVDSTWPDLRVALRTCWSASTRVANWATTQLYARDVRRYPGDEKMPPMPKIYLYPEAREQAPDMDPQSVASLLQGVERKYRARRYDVIWTASQSLPNHRYPVPYPCHNASWSVDRDDDGRRLLSVRLAGQRRSLALRGGKRHRRMLGAVDALIAGKAVKGELSIYQTKASSSTHRPSSEKQTQLMAKMVMWLPKPQTANAKDAVLDVRTGSESLLVYRLGEDEPRYLHADQVRRWIAAHAERLQRLSDDTKAEKRKPKRAMRGINQQREAWCRKHHKRIDSFLHETTAMLANFAERRNVGLVRLNTTARGFAVSFPYHQLETLLAYKLDERGIALEKTTSGDAVAETTDPLEQES